jgi:amidase
MKDDEITSLDATALADAIRTKRVTSRQALEAFVRRNARLGPNLNCVVVLDLKNARKRADELDSKLRRGEIVGPLHGVPMTVKENNDVGGLVTTVGYEENIGRVASSDELMIARILNAGVVIWGKTNLPVGAMDIQSYNNVYGSTSNPWDLKRTPGGSSGGGACAVAAGISPIELGGGTFSLSFIHTHALIHNLITDVGGSIRTPAAFCGIYGHKPTFGLIPKVGPHLELREKEISVRGPLSKSARDLAMIMNVVGGSASDVISLHLPRPAKTSLSEYRVAVWADDPMCRVDDDIREAATNLAWTLRSRGVDVSFTARPDFDLEHNVETYKRLTSANSALNGETNGVTLTQYRIAQEAQGRIREAWSRFFRSYDILIVPSHCTPAFPKDESSKAGRTIDLVVDGKNVTMPYWRALFWAILTNVGLLPSTTFPCGLGKRTNLPIGLNVVGPEWSDFITIDFARLLAKDCGCIFRPPPTTLSSLPSSCNSKGGGGSSSSSSRSKL